VCTKNTASVIKKIRAALNEILSKNQFNKILVKGRYSTYPRMFNGIFDGFLELTSIDIFNEDGITKVFMIEGILGGIKGRK
jgi:hypothetical protein